MKKFKPNTNEWIYVVVLLSFVIFWVGYKTIIQPIQKKDKVVPAFIEKVETPKPVVATPLPVRPIEQPALKPATIDRQEEALNKMGLTKQGGAKLVPPGSTSNGN